jgi:hypothetical protein
MAGATTGGVRGEGVHSVQHHRPLCNIIPCGLTQSRWYAEGKGCYKGPKKNTKTPRTSTFTNLLYNCRIGPFSSDETVEELVKRAQTATATRDAYRIVHAVTG